MIPKQPILSTTFFAENLVNPTNDFHDFCNFVVQLPNYIFWKNRQLQYMGCNNNFARIAKLNSPADIAGKTDYDLSWNSESAEQLIKRDQQAIQTGMPLRSRSTLLFATDDKAQPIHVCTHNIPIPDKNDHVIIVVSMAVDLRIKWVEEWEQKFTELSNTLSTAKENCTAGETREVVIDWDGCVRMCENDPEFAKQILAGLVEQIKKCQTTFAQAYAAKDITALRAELHSCIGGVCYMKLPQLERTLNDLQAAVQADSQDLNKLEITYLAVQAAMDNFLRECERSDFS